MGVREGLVTSVGVREGLVMCVCEGGVSDVWV